MSDPSRRRYEDSGTCEMCGADDAYKDDARAKVICGDCDLKLTLDELGIDP